MANKVKNLLRVTQRTVTFYVATRKILKAMLKESKKLKELKFYPIYKEII